MGGEGSPSDAEYQAAIAESDAAVNRLLTTFFATPYRPTGLSTAARAVVRLVDELKWLNGIVVLTAAKPPPGMTVDRRACAVKQAAAVVLDRCADLLDMPRQSLDPLQVALAELRERLADLERGATMSVPETTRGDDVISALDPGFRAQELSFVVMQIASNVALSATAERRSWLDQVLGRRPIGLAERLSTAQERAGSHVEPHSLWLQNSVRGAVALGLAVLVSQLTGVQHAFWVVFGTLAVLRSSALNTGQNVVRALLGSVLGFAVGAGLVALIGTNTTLFWFLLPLAVLFAGFAPAAISFAAGQAAFTVTLLILYSILQPAGLELGLVRIEDVAIGCGVSLAVGLLFWPRAAAAALGDALSQAYVASANYLARAVEYGMSRCDGSGPAPPPPSAEAVEAAAASRRLDDTFRGYLAERGSKRVPMAEATSLVGGVAGLRLAGDAVLDLWQRDDPAGGDRQAARRELLANARQMTGWYDGFAASLSGHGSVPEPLARDRLAETRLVEAVGHDLRDSDGQATATAVRMIWTGDHLDAARRLQASLVEPARAAGL